MYDFHVFRVNEQCSFLIKVYSSVELKEFQYEVCSNRNNCCGSFTGCDCSYE